MLLESSFLFVGLHQVRLSYAECLAQRPLCPAARVHKQTRHLSSLSSGLQTHSKPIYVHDLSSSSLYASPRIHLCHRSRAQFEATRTCFQMVG